MALPGWTAAAQQYPAYSPNTQCTRSHKGRFVGSPGERGVSGGRGSRHTADLTSATAGDNERRQQRATPPLVPTRPFVSRWREITTARPVADNQILLTAGVQKSGRSSGTKEQHRMQYPFSPLDGSKSYTGLAF